LGEPEHEFAEGPYHSNEKNQTAEDSVQGVAGALLEYYKPEDKVCDCNKKGCQCVRVRVGNHDTLFVLVSINLLSAGESKKKRLV
jgi:hypothetical protein